MIFYCDSHITPKGQWLLRHVLPFIKKHGFYGTASEQGVEALHKLINNDLRRLCAIRNEQMLFFQIVELQAQRNFFFDTF